ncbi:ABC transporter permease [Paenibacillus oceani]|uniref:Transport permease protein n=1 Tax=Paenibacillus oceani TaxID=2772510 RepID=A0A927CFF9_9BACL|nr:ABC transporter permease [Paenibacillus oceani]MBD2864805.1 ABC transporter permease [Paenibacillus oceani]
MTYFKKIYIGRHVLVSLFKQDLKNRYRNSILGIAWNFLSPLGIVLVIGAVYSIVFNISMKEFVPYLFAGLLPWLFFTSSAEGGAFSFLGSQGYIKQTQVPIEIFPLRVSMVNLFNLIFAIISFFVVYIFISPQNFSISMLLVIPSLLIWFMLCSAWATIAAIINLYIRDFQPLQTLVLQGVFYVSPIIYKPEMLQTKNFQWIYIYNPFYYYVEIIRKPLLGESLPSLNSWIICIITTLFLLQIAMFMIWKIGRNITFRL